MIKVLITLLTSFLIWFGIVKIFTKDNENSINVLSSKLFNDFTLIFRNIITIIDTLFKSFIQIYELFGTFLKNVAEIFKSLMSAFIQFLNLFKIIGITFLSFISLCKGLFQASRKINIFNNFELVINNSDSAKNNVIELTFIINDNLYIDYDSADFVDASKASTSITVNPFNFTQFKGTLKLSPSSDEWRDTETRTGKVVDGGIQLDTKQAYLWNNHEWNWGGKELEDLKVGSRTNNAKNSIFNKVVTDEKIREVIGTKVVDTALIPFMRQKKIYFKAEALRPNTQHFAYFDETSVTSFVREETFVRYADDQTDYGNTKKSITSHPEGASILVSDSDGAIEGSFFIKAQTFKTGTKELV